MRKIYIIFIDSISAYRYKRKRDISADDSVGINEEIVLSPRGKAEKILPGPLPILTVNGKCSSEEYIRNIEELKIEMAKSKPNKTHIKKLLQV